MCVDVASRRAHVRLHVRSARPVLSLLARRGSSLASTSDRARARSFVTRGRERTSASQSRFVRCSTSHAKVPRVELCSCRYAVLSPAHAAGRTLMSRRPPPKRYMTYTRAEEADVDAAKVR